MNLPFFERFNKKTLPAYYLVLILRDEKAHAVIFEELEGIVKIIGQKEEHFPDTIDQTTPEHFLQILDRAISSAESSLPENIQTQKTIFGVKESWTEKEQIKKEYLAKLKKASEELGLVPIGFLVISQAISHLLQKEEGVPVSAILTEVNKKSVTVTLLRAGKSIETRSSEIHESIPFTVDTLLKHFNSQEILPSRIIIFNGKEDFSQDFISHTWSKSLPFLHLPQITNLPHNFDAKAVLFGAATQLGLEVLDKDLPKEPSTEEPIENMGVNPDVVEEKNEEVKEEVIQEPDLYKNLGAQDFGFAKDIDVAKMEFKEPETPAEEIVSEPEIIPQFADNPKAQPKAAKKLNNFLTQIKTLSVGIFGRISSYIKRINFKGLSFPSKGKLTVLVPIIPVLIILLIAGYYLFLRATITILVDPQISEQNKSITFSTTGETDPGQNIIGGEFVTVSEDGTASTPTTGKKDIGTQAKGKATIFNSLTQSKTLAAGTIITSTNGLEFTLDSAVTINSVASHSADETVTPVSVSVNVTASQLGKESNLPSGTKFSVDSFETSDLIAKNDDPFSGGTKTQITVASKADSTKLETDLIKQLEAKAKEDLQTQLGQDKVLLPAFITQTLSKNVLSAKVGDQTNQLTLNGTVEYQGISYKKSDLITFSKSLLSSNVPSNQEIDYNNIKTTVLDIKNNTADEILANLNIKGLLLPKIDQVNLAKTLKGKSFKTAQDVIYKLPQVANVTITFSPNIPFLPKNLPMMEKNIKVLIKING